MIIDWGYDYIKFNVSYILLDLVSLLYNVMDFDLQPFRRVICDEYSLSSKFHH